MTSLVTSSKGSASLANLISQGEAKSLKREDYLYAFEKEKFKTTPMTHQYASMAWAMVRNEVMFLHDIGTGKTLTAIYTTQLWDVDRVLVVCPTSVMGTWKEQLEDHSSYTYALLEGTSQNRRNIVKNDFSRFHIINYEGLKTVWADKKEVVIKDRGKAKKVNKFLPNRQAITKSGYDCIILDEFHRVKDWESLQTQVIYDLSLFADKKIMMSGTPVAKDVRDFWAEMMVLDDGETLGSIQFEFLHTYMNLIDFGTGKHSFKEWVPKKGSVDKILKLISPKAMRYDVEECFDLPEKIYQKRYVNLSSEQIKATDAVINNLKLELGDGELSIDNVENKASKLVQIASGFYYQYDAKGNRKIYHFAKVPKIEEFISMLQTEIHGKVIVFHNFVETAHILEVRLKKAKIKSRAVRGEITNKSKQLEDFKTKPDVRVLLAHPKSGGEGLNLQCAHTIVFIEQLYEGSTLRPQCEGRVWRKGQKERCLMLDIMAVHPRNSHACIDEYIAEMAKGKKDMAHYLLDWVRDIS